VESGRSLRTFRRTALPPSSGLKSKSMKQSEASNQREVRDVLVANVFAGYLLALFSDPEKGDNTLLRKVGKSPHTRYSSADAELPARTTIM
jgi:hypothetical protein